jgi:hypothetical protein
MKYNIELVSSVLLGMYPEDDTINVRTFWDKDEM